MIPLERATALITGATGGIGRELAVQLASRGTRLVLAGRDAVRLVELAGRTGGMACPGDLATPEARQQLVDAASARGVDLLINAAGVPSFGRYQSMTESDITAAALVNLTVPMLLTRSLLPTFLTREAAMIVNVGSTFGRLGFPGFAVYSATKAGLRGFSEALRRELADTRVQVLHFSPRATRTEFNDSRVNALNRAMNTPVDPPEAVARALLQAIERGAADVQYGWPEKGFVQINQLLPRLVDRALRGKLRAVQTAADISSTQQETTK